MVSLYVVFTATWHYTRIEGGFVKLLGTMMDFAELLGTCAHIHTYAHFAFSKDMGTDSQIPWILWRLHTYTGFIFLTTNIGSFRWVMGVFSSTKNMYSENYLKCPNLPIKLNFTDMPLPITSIY